MSFNFLFLLSIVKILPKAAVHTKKATLTGIFQIIFQGKR